MKARLTRLAALEAALAVHNDPITQITRLIVEAGVDGPRVTARLFKVRIGEHSWTAYLPDPTFTGDYPL